MSEQKKIVQNPVTKDQLKAALVKLGVKKGQIIEVHTKLSSFDWMIGGAETVVDALMELEGEGGTILMPVQSSGNSEPSDWVNPPVAPEMYKAVRAAMPPFSPEHSDISGMGDVVENFRHRADVVISNHPNCAYAAWGRYARLLCNRQSLHFALAEESPTARLYELKGYVLLIGADFESATCMHLAEYRTDSRPIKIMGACVDEGRGPEWKKYLDLDIDSSIFPKICSQMARKNMIREIMLGGSHIQFFSATSAIDEATAYFENTSVYELYR
jgi:aminoglycoside 3-N-acetyltransferase